MAHLKTEQLSKRFGIAEGTLRWWRSRNQGPQSFKLGRTVYYDEADVSAWVAAQKKVTGRGEVLR